MELTGSLAPFWPSSILLLHVFFLFFITILCPQQADCLTQLGNETDKLALLEFNAQITNDPNGFFRLWNDSVHFCKWQGVACGRKHQRVRSLDLNDLSLSGTVSPHAGNLTFLRYLGLASNNFHGEIPKEIGQLFRLRIIEMRNNSLSGEIPRDISNCSELRIMSLIKNNLAGNIPSQLGSLKKLVVLYLGGNKLTGEIPHSLGNLSSLQDFFLSENHLQGKIPTGLGQLRNLTVFTVGANNLSGTIPPALYNIPSITTFETTNNQFTGSLPANLGLTLPNLQELFFAQNEYFGSIPESLANASRLRLIDISNNSFTGQFPTDLGYLKGLESLHLEFNFFGSNTSQDLSFVPSLANCSNLQQLYFDGNNFGGALPSSIGNLSNLVQLGFGRNPISGTIPEEVGNLVNLYRLDMDRNFFSGSIPISFGKLQKLERLTLNQNLLSGEIPASLGNITKLYWLELEGNKFQGNITPSLGSCRNLRFLDVSRNKLTGFIPREILGLSSLSETLNLSQNSLTGPLPLEVGSLRSINALDVSENKLSGEIPRTIGDLSRLEILNMQEKLLFLQYLNLSFNNFEGEVPKTGVFSNASAFSLVGNKNLCGGIPEFQLSACPGKEEKLRRPSIVIVLTTTISSFILVVIATSFYLFYRRKSKRNPISSPFMVDKLPQISYGELLKATDGFSSENLIGQGSFGSVYKGSLDQQGQGLVAVKPSNILLDNDMTAHVGDFGLARVISESTSNSSQSQIFSTGIKGTIGYMAPGNIFHTSFFFNRHIWKEMFTGKRPTHEIFTDGLDLHNFVKAKLPGQVRQVVDPTLFTPGEVEAATTAAAENMDDCECIEDSVEECVVSVLQIGLACSAEVPQDRMNMRDVTSKLNSIRVSFTGTRN
ncbi:putative receptor-like protein kinase At3g47110 [Manihot esculenta]|uniref:putative receptor-like protein kinase At3g47110 n=1 Tax=Manihot esculenta TaxID=3983 RepID=UPI001CC6DCFD|nr:putative receptor-like protein kinase At3g47110 [Manihot esculenta]